MKDGKKQPEFFSTRLDLLKIGTELQDLHETIDKENVKLFVDGVVDFLGEVIANQTKGKVPTGDEVTDFFATLKDKHAKLYEDHCDQLGEFIMNTIGDIYSIAYAEGSVCATDGLIDGIRYGMKEGKIREDERLSVYLDRAHEMVHKETDEKLKDRDMKVYTVNSDEEEGGENGAD